MARVEISGVKITQTEVEVVIKTTLPNVEAIPKLDKLCKNEISSIVNEAFGV
jgi:hypothetical protein